MKQHYKSEHWAPCCNQTQSWYDWRIVESDVKTRTNNNNSYWRMYVPLVLVSSLREQSLRIVLVSSLGDQSLPVVQVSSFGDQSLPVVLVSSLGDQSLPIVLVSSLGDQSLPRNSVSRLNSPAWHDLNSVDCTGKRPTKNKHLVIAIFSVKIRLFDVLSGNLSKSKLLTNICELTHKTSGLK